MSRQIRHRRRTRYRPESCDASWGRRHAVPPLLSLIGLWLSLGGCEVDDIVARERGDSDPSGDAAIAAACLSDAPWRAIGGCPDARLAFGHAFCSCQDWVASDTVYVDSFSSVRGPYSRPSAGNDAAVAVNGRVALNHALTLRGELSVGLGMALPVGAPIEIEGDVRSGGAISGQSLIHIGGDALVAGDVEARTLTIDGSLTLPANAMIRVASLGAIGGGEQREPVVVEPECDCVDPWDVAARVEARRAANDNERAGFVPSDFDGFPGTTSAVLPCGELFIPRLAGDGDLQLVVRGSTALFVDGSVSIRGSLSVILDSPRAELDLFIAGDISVSSTLRLGDELRPSQVRLYVGGNGTIQLASDSIVGGGLYAPRAELVVAGALTIYGSAFVRRLSASGPVEIHYDTATADSLSRCTN